MPNSKQDDQAETPALLPLSVGSQVYVARLKKNGIVREAMSRDRYRVCVGSLAITCSESELTPVQVNRAWPARPARAGIPKLPSPATTLDLHGHTVDEAIRKLEHWIDRAILADLSRIKVIHGFGTGKVQRAVHQFLGAQNAVVSFKLNQFNSGETDIFL